MDVLSNTLVLSRIQFALTAIFHMLWPIMTTGMGIYLVVVEGLWLKTKQQEYYYHARFWAKLYLLNFGIGVASGIPMEFQFGTNWAPFSEATGDFFGSVLGFEASMAFMLEAGFLGIMMFGWQRVPPFMHYISTIMVAFGANLSIFWILSANSWMQTPAGVKLVAGKFVVLNYFEAIFNPFMAYSVLHTFLATLETSLFVVGGISAWYILQDRHRAFFTRSLTIALAAIVVVAPAQIWVGHLSGEQVYRHQPTKFAAMESLWETIPAQTPAAESLIALPNEKASRNNFELSIPGALSWILEIKPRLDTPIYGLNNWKPDDRPKLIGLIYYAFRTMIAVGFFFVGLMLWSGIQWLRGKLKPEVISAQVWLLRAWLLAAPLGYLAVESGWIVRCVGRQPWIVYGKIRTMDAVSSIPAGNVLASLITFAVVYSLLFGCAIYFGKRILDHGPDFDLPLPSFPRIEPPSPMIPDRRLTESREEV